MDLPACTLCEGVSPPEGVGGVEGYRDFYRIIQNPKDPEYESKKAWAGPAWFWKETAEAITSSFHNPFGRAAEAGDL